MGKSKKEREKEREREREREKRERVKKRIGSHNPKFIILKFINISLG